MKYKGFPISLRNNFSTNLKLPFSIAALLVVSSSSMLLPVEESKANVAKKGNAQTQTLIAQQNVASSIIYVNPQTGTNQAGAGTTEAAPFKTITFALEQAQPGTVIQLAPGTYSEETGEKFPLRVKQGVTLRGDEAGKGQATLITGSGRYTSRTFASQNITILAGKDSTISGVTVTNPASRGTGIWVESTNPKIINSTFTNNLREGVFVTGTGNPTIAGNIFIQNKGNGVSVAKSAKGEIRGNLFQDTGFGLAIGGTSTPLIAENQILQNVDGLFISNSAQPVLRKNVIQNNTRDGIVVITTAKPNLGTAEEPGGNLIRNNERYDVNNAARNIQILAIGNDIDESKISGQVEFVAAAVDAPPGATAFVDVAPNYWAKSYIEALASKGVIAGFPDGSFKPNEPVTRAQFAAIINKAFAPQAQQQATNFSDVSTNFWAYNAIQTATRSPFLAGYPNNTFRPQLEIPRVQVLVALANGLGLSANNQNVTSVYADADQIPSWAQPSVAAATSRGLVVNYPTATQLNPSRQATRAEVAAFVYQALVNAGQAEAIPSPYVVIVQQ
jgi:parallel beta-helix repeat protein